jgi:hypothetical protein
MGKIPGKNRAKKNFHKISRPEKKFPGKNGRKKFSTKLPCPEKTDEKLPKKKLPANPGRLRSSPR